MKMKYFLWVLMVLIVAAVPSPTLADYQEGTAAFERGEYETALKEFKESRSGKKQKSVELHSRSNPIRLFSMPRAGHQCKRSPETVGHAYP